MSRHRAGWTLAVSLILSSAAVVADAEGSSFPDYGEAFAKLQRLEGTWTIEGNVSIVTYRLTGNRSAVIEEFTGKRGMASVYHLDGDELRMTHYCSAGNQPRMKATSYDAESGRLRFDFVDVTNVTDPDEYYTRQLEIVFRDEDHIRLWFNGLGGGKEYPVVHELTRRR